MADEDESDKPRCSNTGASDGWWARFVRHVERERDERAAKKKNEAATDKAARRTAVATIWMAIFTFVLAATSGFTIWILKNQLKEMHEGGIDTHALASTASDQADAAQEFSDTAEDISERMSDAVDELSAAADNAKRSISATQDAMRLDQRAWFAPERITGTPRLDEKNGADFRVEATFKNTGKTPARNSTLRMWTEDVPKGSKPKLAGGDVPFVSRSLVAPGAENSSGLDPFKTFFESIDSIPSLKPEEKELMKKSVLKPYADGVITMYFYGRADYEDIFGCIHWTTFCASLLLDHNEASWNVCSEHNDTDENKCIHPKKLSKKAN